MLSCSCTTGVFYSENSLWNNIPRDVVEPPLPEIFNILLSRYWIISSRHTFPQKVDEAIFQGPFQPGLFKGSIRVQHKFFSAKCRGKNRC